MSFIKINKKAACKKKTHTKKSVRTLESKHIQSIKQWCHECIRIHKAGCRQYQISRTGRDNVPI